MSTSNTCLRSYCYSRIALGNSCIICGNGDNKPTKPGIAVVQRFPGSARDNAEREQRRGNVPNTANVRGSVLFGRRLRWAVNVQWKRGVPKPPINMGWLSPPGQTVDLEFQVNSSVPLNCVGSISISWTGLFKFNSSSQSYVQEGGSGSTSIKISEYAQGAPLLSVSINSTQMPLLVNTPPVEIVVKNNGSGPPYITYWFKRRPAAPS